MSKPASPTSSASLETLELLHIVTDRFSHSMRTHLGVASGVVEDIIEGFDLGKDDLKDAQGSLSSIVDTLNSVRDLTNHPKYEPREIDLDSFFAKYAGTSFSNLDNSRLTTSLHPLHLEITGDEQMLLRGMRAVFAYGLHCLEQASKTSNQNDLINFETNCSASTAAASLSFPINNPSIEERISNRSQWKELAKVDHSTASLGLLFADAILSLHGAKTCVLVEKPKMILTASWPS